MWPLKWMRDSRTCWLWMKSYTCGYDLPDPINVPPPTQSDSEDYGDVRYDNDDIHQIIHLVLLWPFHHQSDQGAIWWLATRNQWHFHHGSPNHQGEDLPAQRVGSDHVKRFLSAGLQQRVSWWREIVHGWKSGNTLLPWIDLVRVLICSVRNVWHFVSVWSLIGSFVPQANMEPLPHIGRMH